jgi:hypothetical protein
MSPDLCQEGEGEIVSVPESDGDGLSMLGVTEGRGEGVRLGEWLSGLGRGITEGASVGGGGGTRLTVTFGDGESVL